MRFPRRESAVSEWFSLRNSAMHAISCATQPPAFLSANTDIRGSAIHATAYSSWMRAVSTSYANIPGNTASTHTPAVSLSRRALQACMTALPA
eukprot:3883901-Rhodomonas_salina.7